MYGTVARIRLKPGMEEKFMAYAHEEAGRQVPGFAKEFVYRMDADPNEYFLAVVFESKDAYSANADSPGQRAGYLKFAELIEGEPEWHDGEIIYAGP